MKIFRLSSRMLLLFVVIVASFLAAFIGQIVVNNLSQGPSLVSDQGFIIRPSDDPYVKLRGLDDEISQQQASIVTLYTQEGNQLEPQANGVILTSDGWIAAVDQSAAPQAWTHVRLASGELYPIVSSSSSTAHPVNYVFIDQSDLQPITVNEDYEPQVLTPYALLSQDEWNLGYYTADVQSAELYLSSDEITRYAQISSTAPGVIAVNQKAEMMGMMFGRNMVDAKTIISSLTSLLKSEQITTPSLGIYYIDLSQQGLLERFSNGLTKGALISNAFIQGQEFTSALLVSSNAYRAGLRLGDVISQVDGEELTAEYSLSDAVMSKEVGNSIELTVQRGASEISIETVLQ